MSEQKREKVFVIHGRNTAIRDAMFEFLEAIRLSAIEWNEAVKLTGKPLPYIREIIDAGFANAQALVGILTGDDVARLHPDFCTENDPSYETQFTPQARPNVLLELGMALALHPDQTVLIQVGDIRPLSDLGGLHILRFDNSVAKRQELAQRLELTGCKIVLDGTRWHTAGIFTEPQLNPIQASPFAPKYCLPILNFGKKVHDDFETLHAAYIDPLCRDIDRVISQTI